MIYATLNLTQMKSSIISGIILILITGLAAKFIFNDKIELRYILSERIPTTFIDGNDSESIQQLEILNTGVTEIQKIIIKIHALPRLRALSLSLILRNRNC